MQRRHLLLVFLLLGHRIATAQIYLPNQEVAPGALNLAVTQANLRGTVCIAGWTKTIRPSSSYVRRLEAEQMRTLGLPGSPKDYHLDHRVPLCAGGHPTDPRNLWPQPLEAEWRDADKNQLEASVCRQLCRGDITLQEAQAIFLAPDWTREYERYFGLDRAAHSNAQHEE